MLRPIPSLGSPLSPPKAVAKETVMQIVIVAETYSADSDMGKRHLLQFQGAAVLERKELTIGRYRQMLQLESFVDFFDS